MRPVWSTEATGGLMAVFGSYGRMNICGGCAQEIMATLGCTHECDGCGQHIDRDWEEEARERVPSWPISATDSG